MEFRTKNILSKEFFICAQVLQSSNENVQENKMALISSYILIYQY